MNGVLRVGTWNLKLCPASDSVRGLSAATWLAENEADVWLLTEIHRDWRPRGRHFVVSPPRGAAPAHKRWAGILSSRPLTALGQPAEPSAAEEGLVLARLQVGDAGPTVLVACSVLPWRGAGPYWPGLPDGQVAQFTHVLEHHVARIDAERQAGEPVIWGGDFNQQLTPPYRGASQAGADALRRAFDSLGLVALTSTAEHLNGSTHAIDHLAVSRSLHLGLAAQVHRPALGSRLLSDHAAYNADVRLPDGHEGSLVNDAISIPADLVCPRCGSEDSVPLVMGLPSAERFELADRGLVRLGGCVIGPESPDVACRSCGHEWSSDADVLSQD